MQGWIRWAAVVGAALLAAACSRGVDGKRIEAADAAEWLTYGRTYDEQRFSPLNQINHDTIGKLGVAWWAEFERAYGLLDSAKGHL